MSDDESENIEETIPLPPQHRIKSNVFYYFAILLNQFWNIVATIVFVVFQSLKLYYYPMTKGRHDFTMCAPFLWFAFNIIKSTSAKYGNRSENSPLIIVALLFGIGCILMEVYFLVWQPYLFRWESPFHFVSIIIDAIVFLFSIVMMIMFVISKH